MAEPVPTCRPDISRKACSTTPAKPRTGHARNLSSLRLGDSALPNSKPRLVRALRYIRAGGILPPIATYHRWRSEDRRSSEDAPTEGRTHGPPNSPLLG